jgi:hypothetical protein
MSKVNKQCYIERRPSSLIAMKTSNVHDFYSVECRQHPGHYEYYKNYDDLEARCLFFISLVLVINL